MARYGAIVGRVGAVTLLGGVVVALTSGSANGTAATELDPVRSDIVVHFSSGSVAVNVDGETGMATIDNGEVRLSTNNIRCRPVSENVGCSYTVVNFSLHTAPFSVGSTAVPTMQVQNVNPMYSQFDNTLGMSLSPAWNFDVSGIVGSSPTFSNVTPDPANPLDFHLNLDTQQFTITGLLSGSSGSFSLSLGIMATADSPFANVAPTANAGPDQTVATSCFASVQLDKSGTTDPNGDLSFSYFSEGGQSLGSGSAPIAMFPGHHRLTLVAVDEQSGQSTDDVAINVADNGAVPAITGAQSLTVQTPPGVPADQVVLGASGTLTIADRVTVRPATGAPTPVVVNMGSVSTSFGVDSITSANVWSRAQVSMSERAKIVGSLQTLTIPVTQNGTSVSGVSNAQAVFLPAANVGWNQAIPTKTVQISGLEPGTQAAFSPGSYSQLTVKSNATATLQSGSYVFTGFDLEPQGSLVLQGTSPVFVYTTSGAIFRGSVSTGAGAPAFVLVNLGTQQVTVESPYTGAILAPLSTIQLASSGSTLHRGAFFGANINIAAGATVEYLPFSFDFVRNARSTCALTPSLQCVESLSAGGFRAHFSYANQVPFSGTVVPVGPFNRFSPGAEDRGQPVSFLEGAQAATSGAFSVDFTTPDLTWVLGGRSVTATGGSTQCH